MGNSSQLRGNVQLFTKQAFFFLFYLYIAYPSWIGCLNRPANRWHYAIYCVLEQSLLRHSVKQTSSLLFAQQKISGSIKGSSWRHFLKSFQLHFIL